MALRFVANCASFSAFQPATRASRVCSFCCSSCRVSSARALSPASLRFAARSSISFWYSAGISFRISWLAAYSLSSAPSFCPLPRPALSSSSFSFALAACARSLSISSPSFASSLVAPARRSFTCSSTSDKPRKSSSPFFASLAASAAASAGISLLLIVRSVSFAWSISMIGSSSFNWIFAFSISSLVGPLSIGWRGPARSAAEPKSPRLSGCFGGFQFT